MSLSYEENGENDLFFLRITNGENDRAVVNSRIWRKKEEDGDIVPALISALVRT